MSAWRETEQPDAGTSNSRCSQPNLNNLKNVCTTATSSLADLSRESRKPYRCSRSVDLTLRRSVETDPNEKKNHGRINALSVYVVSSNFTVDDHLPGQYVCISKDSIRDGSQRFNGGHRQNINVIVKPIDPSLL